MKTKEEIGDLLESILGNKNVYFQAPPNTGMKYPCIVYRFAHYNMDHADNKPYLVTGRWEIHHMYKSVKNDLKEKFVFDVPYCQFDRRMITDGVYNDFYTINQ